MPARRAASLAESFALTRALVIRTPHGGGAGRWAMAQPSHDLRTAVQSSRSAGAARYRGTYQQKWVSAVGSVTPTTVLTLRTPDTRVTHAVAELAPGRGLTGGRPP